MSKKAEETALRFYPESSGPLERSIFDDRRVTLACRRACQQGYEQAEEDIALTWEDVKEIQRLIDVVWSEQDLCAPINEDTIYKEALRRFNKTRNTCYRQK